MSHLESLQRLTKISGPILVTGHTGFKGAWLGALLNELSIPFVGLALRPESESLYRQLSIGKPLREYLCDIRDISNVAEIVRREQPSCLIHLAAQPLVINSFLNPLETFETNVMGTVNVLEAFRLHNPSSPLGIVTTDKVYLPLPDNTHRHSEKDAMLGTEPYSASKVSAENAIIAWRAIRSENMQPIIALRSGNVIGGGDHAANRLLPDLIRAYLSQDTLRIRFPSATRPWQHVLDPLYGYLLALAWGYQSQQSGDFNFGPIENSLTVQEVVAIADREWGIDDRMPYVDDIAVGETKNLMLNSSHAQETLGWTPVHSQVQAIESTIRWWKTSMALGPDHATRVDLEAFLELTL